MATTITGTTIDVGPNKLVADSAGNVGVGTASPTLPLDIVSNASADALKLRARSGNDYATMTFSSNDGATKWADIQSNVAKDLRFYTNGSSETMRIDSAGIVTKPLQPAFSVDASVQYNFPINTVVTVPFDVEVFDVGANFNTSTKTFTAPVTGKYQLNVTVHMRGIDSAANYYEAVLNTSNRVYSNFTDGEGGTDPDTYTLTISQLCDMDLGDTAYVTINQSGGAAQTDLRQGCHFSGYLAL